MAFEPGHQKVGGRGKGVPNRATTLVRELARRLVQDPKYLACFIHERAHPRSQRVPNGS